MLTFRGCRRRWGGLTLLGLLTLAGCQTPPARSSSPARTAKPKAAHQVVMTADGKPITNTDACANRMHELCGPLLLYYAQKHRLPKDLEELRQLPGVGDIPAFTCPVSGRPYVYDPSGLPGTEPGSWVVLYDPAASHSGMRWAISITAKTASAPVTKVVALPDSFFAPK